MGKIKFAAGLLFLLGVGWLIVLHFLWRPVIFAEILTYRGNQSLQRADFGDAEVLYKKAETWHPEIKPSVGYNLGNSYYHQGRYSEAGNAYKEQLKAENKPETWFNLGNSLFLSGDTLRSLKAFEKALVLDGADDEIRQNYLFVRKALKLASRKNQPDPAKEPDKNKDQPEKESSEKGGEEKGKPGQEKPDEKAEISEKAMEDLLNQIRKNEEAVRGKINNSKQVNKKLPPGELDY